MSRLSYKNPGSKAQWFAHRPLNKIGFFVFYNKSAQYLTIK